MRREVVPNSSTNPDDVDFVASRKLMGLVLGDEVLLLKYRSMKTIRIPWFEFHACRGLAFGRCKFRTDRDYLRTFFGENIDNPFALLNAISDLRALDHVDATNILTQLPPLNFHKTAQAQSRKIDELCELAQPGDFICTYDRGSMVSKLIRYVDKGYWSHVGIVDQRLLVTEATTSGVVKSSFSTLKRHTLDVGLYRYNNKPSPTQLEASMAFCDAQIGKPYDWSVLFRAPLLRWFRIGKSSDSPLPSDFMRNNMVSLIDYA